MRTFAGTQPKFSLTGPVVPRTQRSNTALIKLSLIKVFLILLAGLIDLICFRAAIGCDLYLVNELIDLAPSAFEWIQRILTCCFFYLAHGPSLGHFNRDLENGFLPVGLHMDTNSSKKSNFSRL